jgi:hypothetical protein
MTDKRIETYLRKSTRGLWGRRRADVREELSSHIEGRVHAHLVGGLCESDAVEKTLTELGQPTHVSMGMARLYTLPVVAGSGLMLAMCCALVVVLLSGSTAQTLQMFDVFPADECFATANQENWTSLCESQTLWVNVDELQRALEPQGIRLTNQYSLPVLEFADGKTFPVTDTTGTIELDGKMINTKPGYINVQDLIQGLNSRDDASVQLSGWDAPTIKVNNVFIEMTNSETPISGLDFYLPYLWNYTWKANSTNTVASWVNFDYRAEQDASKFRTVQLNIGGTEGEVYGIITTRKPTDIYFGNTTDLVTFIHYADAAPADANGRITVHIPVEAFSFSDKISELDTAVVIRLSGELPKRQEYVSVPPDQITLE